MTQVKLEFELGVCNGTMHIDIYEQERLLASNKNIDTSWKTNFIVTWPSKLTIKLSNKDMQRDTQIDSNGNIVANKYVKLIYMDVNGFALSEPSMYNICQYSPNGAEQINEIFWGFPGEVNIHFNQPNPMRWNLELNNVLFFRET